MPPRRGMGIDEQGAEQSGEIPRFSRRTELFPDSGSTIFVKPWVCSSCFSRGLSPIASPLSPMRGRSYRVFDVPTFINLKVPPARGVCS